METQRKGLCTSCRGWYRKKRKKLAECTREICAIREKCAIKNFWSHRK